MPSENSNNPYPGPRPFQTGEEQLFFGRERENREIVTQVFAHRVLFLYAQSGAGKTSLLNASLVPALKQEGFEILPTVRVGAPVPEKEIDIREVMNIYAFNTLMAWRVEGDDLRSLLAATLADALSRRERKVDEQGKPLPRVLIFDQFEELLISYNERWTERESFFRQLAKVIDDDRQLRVIFVLREDYLGGLDPYADLLPERPAMRVRLERLRAQPARLAVEGPLKNTRRRFGEGVAERLIQQLLTVKSVDAEGRSTETAGEFVEPVQLQVVCTMLWDDLPPDVTEITHEHVQEFGDVNEALAEFYDHSIARVLKNKNVSEGELRNWFEHTLITPAGTRGSVFMGEKKTGDIPNEVVRDLEELHLVRGESRAGARWYELTHDRFIEPIIQSNNRWREKRPQAERVKQGLEDKALLWTRGGGELLDEVDLREAERWLSTPEASEMGSSPTLRAFVQASHAEAESQKFKEQQRRLEEKERVTARLRRLVAALVTVFLIAVAAAAFAWTQRSLAIASADKASQEQRKADDLRNRAESEALRAQDEQKKAEIARADATEQAKIAKEEAVRATQKEQEAQRARAEAIRERARAVEQSDRADEAARVANAKTKEVIEARDRLVVALADVKRERDRADQLARDALKAQGEAQKQSRISDSLAASASAVSETDSSPVESAWKALNSVSNLLQSDKMVTQDGIRSVVSALPAALVRETLVGHNTEVTSVGFSKDGKHLATASADGTAKLWDLSSSAPETTVTGRFDGVGKKNESLTHTTVSSDGTLLAVGSDHGNALLYDLSSGKSEPLGKELDLHWHPVHKMAISDDGKYLASASSLWSWSVSDISSRNGRDRLWRRPHLLSRLKIWKAPQIVNSFAFSHDGKLIAVAFQKGTVSILDLKSGRSHFKQADFPVLIPSMARGIPGKPDVPLGLTFSPNDKLLVIGGQSGEAHVWEIAEDRVIPMNGLVGHHNPIVDVAFSPDGKLIATASQDRTVKLWDAELAGEYLLKELATLPGHKGYVNGVAFAPLDELHPSRTLLATVSSDRTAKLWDVSSIKEFNALLRELGQVGSRVDSSGVSPPRTGSLSIDELLKRARGFVLRSMTDEDCRRLLKTEKCPRPDG